LRILRSHGIPETSLLGVFRATVISKLTYTAHHRGLMLVPLPTVPSWNHLSTDARDLATAVTTSRHTVNLSVKLTKVFSNASSPTMDTFYKHCYQTVLPFHTVSVK